MISFGLGLFLSAVIYLSYIYFQQIEWLIVPLGVMGIGGIILGGIISGAFQVKAAPGESFTREATSERNLKTNWSTRVFLFSLPSFVALILSMIGQF
ncbi:DUF5316 family protein [Geomicrobium sp. JSM 1781026]|uniref:DUF5316 family protein n=1 Tax=Geomicrobium sp. JSM 1781026 TaxID=3344580 RepID=UPI0035C10419